MTIAPTILIVEDNPLVAKFYRMALERAGGFSCIVTENVGEILELAGRGAVQLAIIDVSLSGTEWQGRILDGVELAQMVKKNASAPLPILLATAHAMAGDRERLLQASGADGYLEKPIYEADVLVAQVREMLAGAKKSR